MAMEFLLRFLLLVLLPFLLRPPLPRYWPLMITMMMPIYDDADDDDYDADDDDNDADDNDNDDDADL